MAFGITAKKQSKFHDWYTQVVINAELLDYYDIRGCFIMRPNGMRIWKCIRDYFDEKIGEMGVEEAYFPMLVTKENIEKEKNHLANFNPELAWITRCGETELDQPVAIRPTSETIIYPAMSKWLTIHRDLPMKINQWCSVLRWEVKSTLPFIRGREFLWQEGHTAYYGKKDAEEECREILEIYAHIYEKLLAIPVVRGIKSKNETFGGAEYTLTIEAFIPGTGKGVQAATSHHLGQNFAKMFEIKVQDDVKQERLVYQNCWGLTTRSIGIATMIHSDDTGFMCGPRVANIQVVIILCGITSKKEEEEVSKLKKYAYFVEEKLKEHKIRVHVDIKEGQTAGFKFNHWELMGVPIRLEIGFRDMEKNEVCCARRDLGKNRKQLKVDNLVKEVQAEMDQMHMNLYEKAKAERDLRTKQVDTFDELLAELNNKNVVLAPWCNNSECEDEIGERTTIRENDEVVTQGGKTLCIPFEKPSSAGKMCVNCNKCAETYVLIGRSY
ncbi:SYP [Enterospora canceri]|uniref:Proline--tRNA ligase n=1 Tax=Enterospora canceri TaxID=1081671 RepID=A0A1Y1S6N9_9MICR|nr:SYP [Enterospora canceri]